MKQKTKVLRVWKESRYTFEYEHEYKKCETLVLKVYEAHCGGYNVSMESSQSRHPIILGNYAKTPSFRIVKKLALERIRLRLLDVR